ncbi:DnaD domain-containing protein [Domibacillus tundrae]|uniref:DnaD domain-containing protein n=1 Tax=Domibacillus tundrae TaxID=1587527 RepID=UPI0006964BB6|nr:DnaD domain protein [Domibacillus tundrae]
MNYQENVDAFYDQLELNPLSSSAVALWHALLHINKKAAWITSFTVAASVLCVKSGLTDSSFKRARNELKQTGYIAFQSRKGNQSATYQMLIAVQYGPQSEPKTHLSSNMDHKATCNVDHKVNHSPDHKADPLYRQIERQNDGPTDSPATFKDIMDSWREVLRFEMKQNHIEMVSSYLDQDGMTESLILEGIERVKMADDPNMRYLWTILTNWAKAGVKTIPDLVEYEKGRADQRPPSTNVKQFPQKKQEETISERFARLKREGRIPSGG